MIKDLFHSIRMIAAVGIWLAGGGLHPVSAAVQPVLHGTTVTLVTNAAGNVKVEMELHPTGKVEVVPFAPDVVRVRYHFVGLYDREEVAIDKPWDDWPAFASSISLAASNHVTIDTGELLIEIDATNEFRLHVHSPGGFPLVEGQGMAYDPLYFPIGDTQAYAQVEWPLGSTSVSNFPSGFKLQATKAMRPFEAFFGLGDAGGPLNRRGQKIQFWTQDTYNFEKSRSPKYTALPMLYGMSGPGSNHPTYAYGLFFNNPARPVFDLSGANAWTFEAGDDQMDYFVFGGGLAHTADKVIDRFSELTGRPAMLPKWALGYHQSRHSYGSQQAVLDVIEGLWSNAIPADAVYLDIGAQDVVSGQNAQLTLNASFTNLPGLQAVASNRGVQLVSIVEPCLTTNDPLYPTAFTNLYFLKDNSLANYLGTNFLGWISWLDFSITDTVDWWTGQLTNYLAWTGFSGIWNDLNEPNENAMPLDALWFLDGRYGGGTNVTDTRKWHQNNKNTYSIWSARVTREAMQTHAPATRPFVLSRSAWPGIQKHALGWSGDNLSTFNHLRFNNVFGLNVMISGQAWYGHDIGGFVGSPDGELMVRWTQSGALQPYFRNHTTIGEPAQEPWRFGEDNLNVMRRWIEFRYALMPWLYTHAAAAATNGLPLNTPTAFAFPGDTNTFFLNDNEYLVGGDLLVAPVVEDGARWREVYLPFGANWYHWQTGAYYLGGQAVTLPVSLSDLPLFVREGAVLVMGPVQRYANQGPLSHLDVHLWRGAGSFELYEDDGISTNYLAGTYAKTLITSAGSTNAFTATVAARTGAYDPGDRALYLIRHDLDPVDGVTVNGAEVPRYANRDAILVDGWAYDQRTRTLTVRIWHTGQSLDVTADVRDPLDSDGDGMPDWWEAVYAGSATGLTATADGDADGRDNFGEWLARSHPGVADVFTSAGNHMAMTVAGTFNFWNETSGNMRRVGDDRWAAVLDPGGRTSLRFKFVADNAWTNANWGNPAFVTSVVPLSATAVLGGADILVTNLADTLYTFRFNETSLVYAVADAWTVDSDGDGSSDGWECFHGFDPLSPADGPRDADGDGVSNRDEWLAGTGPVSRDQFPRILTALKDAVDPIRLEWVAEAGRRYDVEFSTNAVAGGWWPLPPFTNLSGTGIIGVVHTNPPAGNAFYRVGIRLP